MSEDCAFEGDCIMSDEVKIKKLNPEATIPTRGSDRAAGWDLYAIGEYEIAPGATAKVGTGVAMNPPEGTFGAIFARSGMATKRGLRPANCVGVCDEDYTGEYIVPLYNDSNETRYVHTGDRIAQLVFLPYAPVYFTEVEELDEYDRGSSGFGSTGA